MKGGRVGGRGAGGVVLFGLDTAREIDSVTK